MTGDTPKTPARWPAALLGGVIGAVLTAGAIGAAGYALRDQAKSWLMADDEARIDALDAKQAEIAARLDRLAAQPRQEPPDTAKLEGEIADLRRAIPAEGLILRLTERVDAAEHAAQDVAAAQAAGQALLLTIGQLRDAVDRGDRFAPELAAARHLAQGDETALLDSFAPGAEGGILRRDQLMAQYKPLSETLLQQEADAGATGFWQILGRHIRKVISLRRMDGMGNDAEAVLGRADAAFKQGDWDRAVDSLRALPGPYEATAADWLHQAELRLAADRALSSLTASVAARSAQH